MTQFSPQFLDDLIKSIKEWAKALGFQQIGISDTDLSQQQQYLQKWLDNGYHGNMSFFERNQEKRLDPKLLVPGTVRIISVRLDYLPPDAGFAKSLKNKQQGYISRYALGRDYHKLLRKRLKQLGEKIELQATTAEFRPFVDSAPVLEHAIAQKAGIGWTGKHSLTLNKTAGSWFFLGELFVNIPLPVDQPASDGCGGCNACITICPTQAIVEPYVVDARRCISYLTIEHNGAIPEKLRPLIGNRIYGCDDCQLICPWNRYAQLTSEDDFHPRQQLSNQDLVTLFNWDEQRFLTNTEGSPIRRIGHQKWQRNIAVAMGNADFDPTILSTLNQALEHACELVKEHIRWAIEQQTKRQSQHIEGPTFRVTQRLIRSVEKGLKRDA
ncbi:tRNA epoxyqueuosine(34) reductase QueG [Aliiglaciecola sp. LCG003]|uniref:tRNA epoxyqueuosine(34) reductase QueG n=1 Tax=Aliiglaciecola sp. LCG003 TaxID=3053655 RepID=UPI002573EFCE|nr:tRNA epoxyqueuosine(34) reductase QueG [Aliiglaciecola sp. LCG003]WJG09786.1 tRNA epoxyqueuosine(34) reductase QueG [Aliiglaciecola sp. LCG003]